MDQQVESKSARTGANRAGVMALFVFAFLAVGLGFMQLRNTIYSPFVIRLSRDSGEVSGTRAVEDDLTVKDTDRDGLTDYEELEFHRTSPYLADTDSDGITDPDEITAGTDPLCPEGQACGGTAAEVGEGEVIDPNSPLLESAQAFELGRLLGIEGATGDGASLIEGESPSEGAIGPANPLSDLDAVLSDPEMLRKLISDTGLVTAEQLDAIDDETLSRMATEFFSGRLSAPSPPQ